MIYQFSSKYDFLSNFYNCPVYYNGLLYQNNEAAFQAQKTLDESIRQRFTSYNPMTAKRQGRRLQLRDDWEDIKVNKMYEICLAKFCQNDELAKRLLATGDDYIEEGNYWHDNFWGSCNCNNCLDKKGHNNLGQILMRIRDELKLTRGIYYEN